MKPVSPISYMSFVRSAVLVMEGIHLPVELTMIGCTPMNCKKEDTYSVCFSRLYNSQQEVQ